MVVITAETNDDAYTIFETMNDRGLSLTPTDMLKGYLLAQIDDTKKRNAAVTIWKKQIQEFNKFEKEKDLESDFVKAWFRSQYAEKIRERKRGATPQDFDKIGTEFHRWLRTIAPSIKLKDSEDFYKFIKVNFGFYSQRYLDIHKAANGFEPGLKHIRYNADNGFTLQYMVLMAPLRIDDNDETIFKKLQITSRFLDILINRRLWNLRSTTYSTMQYAMFLVMKEIRGLASEQLAEKLHEELQKPENGTFVTVEDLGLNQQNRKTIHNLLARLTDYPLCHND